MHWNGTAVPLLNSHECHAPSLLVQKVHSMSFNCTDEEIFAASLRARFPNHAERVISETDLPIRTIASSSWPTATNTIDEFPIDYKELTEPSHSWSEEKRGHSLARESQSTSKGFSLRNNQKSVGLSAQELVHAARSLRLRLRLTQRAFAERLGISSRTLQDWEQGRRLPTGPSQVLLYQMVKQAR